jgi:hypothetical protein
LRLLRLRFSTHTAHIALQLHHELQSVWRRSSITLSRIDNLHMVEQMSAATKRTLHTVGIPSVQTSISTLLIVLPLGFIPLGMCYVRIVSYPLDILSTQIFLKTVFLCVAFGLVHRVFIVPAFICVPVRADVCAVHRRIAATTGHRVQQPDIILQSISKKA